MFKVTLKEKSNGEWEDVSTVTMDADELVEFSKTHEYFKVETVEPQMDIAPPGFWAWINEANER